MLTGKKVKQGTSFCYVYGVQFDSYRNYEIIEIMLFYVYLFLSSFFSLGAFTSFTCSLSSSLVYLCKMSNKLCHKKCFTNSLEGQKARYNVVTEL